MIGDPASFRSGEEPWWVAWTGHRDSLVKDAIEFVHDQGAVDFVDLAEYLRARGVPSDGELTLLLGKHAIGDGVFTTQPLNPRNVVLWHHGSAELMTIIELILHREPQVVLERTDVEHYRRSGVERLMYHANGSSPLPAVDFGEELVAGGYEEPTWLPVMFAWAGVE